MSENDIEYTTVQERKKDHQNLILSEDLLSRIPTKEEIQKIRELIEQDNRTRWFWSSLRTWVLAISSILALFTVGYDGLRTILRRLVA